MFMHQNGWGNQVTIISQGTTTKTISYDNAGNPTNYKGATLTWTRGRLLASYKPSGSSYTTTMQYDANGVRCSKTIPTSTQPNVFRYVYDGNNLVRETKSGTSSYTKTFLYNSQGIVGFAIGSTVYTYRKNLFGDIIAIYQGATKKAAYLYDAWGNCTITQDTDGIGTANPFRYRGYYWDNDLQLYYLMSRYYDPATGRFINADSLEYLDPKTIGGLNLYAYCLNNPVMGVDPLGTIIIDPLNNPYQFVKNNIFGIEFRSSNGWEDSIHMHSGIFGRIGFSKYYTKTEGLPGKIYFFGGSSTDMQNAFETVRYVGFGVNLGDIVGAEVQLETLGVGASISIGNLNFSLNMNITGNTSFTIGLDKDLGNGITETTGFTIGINTTALLLIVGAFCFGVPIRDMGFLAP